LFWFRVNTDPTTIQSTKPVPMEEPSRILGESRDERRCVMIREKTITWYLYSDDVHTQAAIVRELDPNKDFALGKMCADGTSKNLWKTDYTLITRLKKSVKKGEAYDFLVYWQENDGPIKLFEGFPKERYHKEARALAARARAMKRERRIAAV